MKAWHIFWYGYHSKSAQIYRERVAHDFDEWAEEKHLYHVKKALYHRGFTA